MNTRRDFIRGLVLADAGSILTAVPVPDSPREVVWIRNEFLQHSTYDQMAFLWWTKLYNPSDFSPEPELYELASHE